MNNVLSWVKTNWLIVVFCVVMVVSLIAGYVGSNMWAKGQRNEFQTRVAAQLSQVQGAKVNYAIPTLTPNEQAVSSSGPPNAAKTAWFAERIQRRVEQAQSLVGVAENFNRGRNQAGSNRLEHVPLVQGLFPAPADERVGNNLRLDFRDTVIGKQGAPSALARLLQRYGAGPVADLSRVASVLTDLQDREREAVFTQSGVDPTPEQDARIKAMLTERRIQEFQRASRDFSMYAEESAFAGSTIPTGRSNFTGAPPLDTCFAWQWDYWVVSDVLAALALANTDADGLRTQLESSVVKRINSLVIEPIRLTPPSMDEQNSGAPPLLPPPTITNRPDPANQDYDIRYVTLRVVVSSERLPVLFDALARTNYMSVIDLDTRAIDSWADLRAGYYYGTEHVVEATIRIETVWLRSWTGPWMPMTVRTALNVVVPDPVPADTSGSN